MARNNHIFNSFIAGEASQKFTGRTDTAQYNQSCEDTLNMLIYPQGGAGSRPGFEHVRRVVNYEGKNVRSARLFPFYASDGQRWQICMTSENPDVPPGHTPGDPYNWFAVNMVTGQVVYILYLGLAPNSATYMENYYPLIGMDLLEIQYHQAANSIILVHKDMRPLIITHGKNPITGDPVFSASPFINDFDTAPGNDTWRRMAFFPPVFVTTATQLKVTTNGSGVISIRPGDANSTGINFDASDIGSYFKFSDGAGMTRVVIATSLINSAEMRGYLAYGTSFGNNFSKNYGNSTTGYYELGAWSERLGWPATVTGFESRLVFGGSRGIPGVLWFSKVGDFDRFDVRKAEQDADFLVAQTTSDPFSTSLRAQVAQEIRWLSSGKTITVGTSAGEFVVQGPSATKSIGIDNIQSNQETPHGSAYVQAVRIENTTAFLQRHRASIRELAYNFDENSFKAADLSIVAEHMHEKSAQSYPDNPSDLYYAEGTVDGYYTQMVMQQVPIPILWCLDRHGQLCALTRERNQEVNAWHYHKIAGNYTVKVPTEDPDPTTWPTFTFDARILSMSMNQMPQVGSPFVTKVEPDEMWVTSRRGWQPDGATTPEPAVYIEKLSQEWRRPKIGSQWDVDSFVKRAPIYMDFAHVTDSSASVTPGVITGLPHMHGETVSVVCDGVYLGDYVVDGGSIDISNRLYGKTTWKAIVGLIYKQHIVPMSPETPAQLGSSMAQPKRIDRITTHFYRTVAAKYGRVESDQQENTPMDGMEAFYMKPGTNQNDPIPFFTGEKKVTFPQGYEPRPKIKIENDRPLPMQITYVVARQVVYE